MIVSLPLIAHCSPHALHQQCAERCFFPPTDPQLPLESTVWSLRAYQTGIMISTFLKLTFLTIGIYHLFMYPDFVKDSRVSVPENISFIVAVMSSKTRYNPLLSLSTILHHYVSLPQYLALLRLRQCYGSFAPAHIQFPAFLLASFANVFYTPAWCAN